MLLAPRGGCWLRYLLVLWSQCGMVLRRLRGRVRRWVCPAGARACLASARWSLLLGLPLARLHELMTYVLPPRVPTARHASTYLLMEDVVQRDAAICAALLNFTARMAPTDYSATPFYLSTSGGGRMQLQYARETGRFSNFCLLHME